MFSQGKQQVEFLMTQLYGASSQGHFVTIRVDGQHTQVERAFSYRRTAFSPSQEWPLHAHQLTWV